MLGEHLKAEGQQWRLRHEAHRGPTGRHTCWPNPTSSQLISLHRSLWRGKHARTGLGLTAGGLLYGALPCFGPDADDCDIMLLNERDPLFPISLIKCRLLISQEHTVIIRAEKGDRETGLHFRWQQVPVYLCICMHLSTVCKCVHLYENMMELPLHFRHNKPFSTDTDKKANYCKTVVFAHKIPIVLCYSVFQSGSL